MSDKCLSDEMVKMLQIIFSSLSRLNLCVVQDDLPHHETDMFFREQFPDAEKRYGNLLRYARRIPSETYLVSEDIFCMNYILVKPLPDSSIFMSAGPFLTSEPDDLFFSKMMGQNGFKQPEIRNFRPFYGSLPVISSIQGIIAAMNAVLEFLNISTDNFVLKRNDRDITLHESIQSQTEVPLEKFITSIEQRYSLENEMCDAIANGDTVRAGRIADKMMNILLPARISNSSRDDKSLLYAANAIYRRAVLQAQVPGYYVYELNASFVVQIDATVTAEQRSKLAAKMLHQYCNLSRNYRRTNYSPVIRSALYYIDVHLTEPLSLDKIAQKLHVSGSYLSRRFHSETGSTISGYIGQQRIHEAVKLINQTQMSFTDISVSVGINDLNYFSRLFRKYIGMTPGAYRKEITELQ